MNPKLRRVLELLLVSFAFAITSVGAETKDSTAPDCSCCAVAPAPEEPESLMIRGVVESVLTERSALLVKHEEIPGFMRAMTMMFQIDPALLPTIKPGDNITAVMKRAQPRGWMLEDIEIIDS